MNLYGNLDIKEMQQKKEIAKAEYDLAFLNLKRRLNLSLTFLSILSFLPIDTIQLKKMS